MSELKVDQETLNKLELARSRVRRIVTYAAMGFVVAVGGYGLVWMGDRATTSIVLTACISWVCYWFGTRKPPEVK